MSTYTQIIYQVVFGTKNNQYILSAPNRQKLFMYIAGILKKKNCHIYRINGVENHIHILFSLHPSVSLSSIVKDIKLASNSYIKSNNLFEKFVGWQSGYGAFTYSMKDKDRLIEYIKNQEEHHRKKSFREEYVELLDEHGVTFDEEYLI
ncbi:IS200/IS605 family transposase [Alkalitalea saponilacus]|uniref:REP element-mobilizing transposase RayT n=1 Tax=Alkalitalea saponilacus TaxID=889453 RepID=A0A1T5HBY6_9BACT|nr:IS200/IS605 family transposase [Alkalitalea saponilacus]ASB50762.1 transposase [Alkalitalea saponilacus]SKC18198.1 REP element-mobilizing transposase RayT [Alkalitalea saponilacus]